MTQHPAWRGTRQHPCSSYPGRFPSTSMPAPTPPACQGPRSFRGACRVSCRVHVNLYPRRWNSRTARRNPLSPPGRSRVEGPKLVALVKPQARMGPREAQHCHSLQTPAHRVQKNPPHTGPHAGPRNARRTSSGSSTNSSRPTTRIPCAGKDRPCSAGGPLSQRAIWPGSRGTRQLLGVIPAPGPSRKHPA